MRRSTPQKLGAKFFELTVSIALTAVSAYFLKFSKKNVNTNKISKPHGVILIFFKYFTICYKLCKLLFTLMGNTILALY